jgi:predicted chitinase
MKKTILTWTICLGTALACYAQKQATLAYRHIFKAQCAQNDIEHILKVIQNVNIPLKIKGNTFVGRKKVRSSTNVMEVADVSSISMPKRFSGNTAAQLTKCFYITDLEVEGTLEDGKVMKVSVKETNKTIDIDYRGKKWNDSDKDDTKFEEIGNLLFKNNAFLKRQGRDNQYFVSLKLTDLTKKNKKKKVKGRQICPVTYDVLQNVLPHVKQNVAEKYAEPLNNAMEEFGINTPARVNMFLAQITHESDNLRIFKEEGKPSRFARYERIKGLGNSQPGDGYRYRGRGPIQITGRLNYRQVGEALGVDLENNPDLLEEPDYAFRAAAWWWKKHGLNEKMDKFPNNVRVATKIINGGYRHLERRQQNYNYIASSMNMLEC